MLLKRIEIEQVEPCFADETKIRVIARIPVDVGELLPYLNAILANATYVETCQGGKGSPGHETTYSADRPALTFTKGQRLVTVYPRRVTIAKADDVEDAEETLAWLVDKLNYASQHREEIEPVTEGKVKIRPLDIFGLLPRTNCRQCGEQGCLAFALLLLQEKRRLKDCLPLYREEQWEGKRKRLEEIIHSLGLE
jgi:ArsR family metal-binding transcriptional regulator